MIDKIRFSKKDLTEIEVKRIVETNRLETYNLNGFKHWNNDKTKNFNGGFSIRIDQNKVLKIEGSLHKYATYLKTKKLDNYSSFSMTEAKNTFNILINNLAVDPNNTYIKFYEIGLNLITKNDPKEFLKNIYSIGDLNNEKIFYVDPKYKKESQKTTETHRDYRLYFKTYDKIHEMLDNKKEVPNYNIIRIETVYKRVEKTLITDFFAKENLKKLQNIFFEKWDKLNFLIEIKAPKGTNYNRILYAKKIIRSGKDSFLNEIEKQYKNKTLSIKLYYTQKRFIENWNLEKINYTPVKSAICKEWEKVYINEKQIYTEKNKMY